jgi:hypothetical protein
MTTVKLPSANGTVEVHRVGLPAEHTRPTGALRSRRAFAAAHVVADPLADNSPVSSATLDWDATLAFRRHLWSWGLAVAEAMDTAQRGMGLDWVATRELIRRSVAEANAEGGDIACGATTDQLSPGPTSLDAIVAAYTEQIDFVEGEGGQAVVMASRQLAASARHADDYREVYSRILGQSNRTVIIHWLGEMFDPALAEYWGSDDLDQATESFLAIISDNADRIDGVKISLLGKAREIDMRRRLPDGVRMYTGDDYEYPDTISGDDTHHSHALLGAFDIIAPAASAAIQAFDRDDTVGFHAILDPTVPLSRHVFGPPTFYYKTGVVFMAYLNGYQSHFRMVHGLESARSVVHLADQFRLADSVGLFDDPELATARMAAFLSTAGIDQG